MLRRDMIFEPDKNNYKKNKTRHKQKQKWTLNKSLVLRLGTYKTSKKKKKQTKTKQQSLFKDKIDPLILFTLSIGKGLPIPMSF